MPFVELPVPLTGFRTHRQNRTSKNDSRRGAPRRYSLKKAHVDHFVQLYKEKRGFSTTNRRRICGRLRFYLDGGLSLSEVEECVRRDPYFLGRRTKPLYTNLKGLSDFGFDERQVKQIVLKKVYDVSADKTIAAFQYLQERITLSKNEFMKMVERIPSLLSLSVERNLIPACDLFLNDLEFDVDAFRLAILKHPHVMTYSVEKKIRPTVEFFVEELGIDISSLGKIIKNYPGIFGFSLGNIRAKAQWLRTRLGMDESGIRRLVSMAPSILGLSMTTLEAKIDNFCCVLGMEEQDCAKLITRCPPVLKLSVENVNETVAYLVDEMHRDRKEVVGCPGVLGFSLSNRIRPRYERLKTAHVPGRDKISLSNFVYWTDDKFDKFVERRTQANAV